MEAGKQPLTLSCCKEVTCSCELEERSLGLEEVPLRESRLQQHQQPLLLCLPLEVKGVGAWGNRGTGPWFPCTNRCFGQPKEHPPAPVCPSKAKSCQAAELTPPTAPRLLRALFNGEVISQRCLKLP